MHKNRQVLSYRKSITITLKIMSICALRQSGESLQNGY